MNYGPDRLRDDLRELGYDEVKLVETSGKQYAVILNFEVPLGRFEGRTIGLAIEAPNNYPQRIANSIHVCAKPQLFECEDSEKGKRNINESPLGPDWRYWSHRFDANGEHATRRLMTQINGVFYHA